MKKFICLILMVIVFPLFAQYSVMEVFDAHYTKVTLCNDKKRSYVLVANGYAEFPEYLIVFDDNNYKAERCYGEFLLAYYYIKNKNKEYKYYNDNDIRYEIILDNTNEEIAFLRALTDEFILQDYPTFFFIDKNSSKKEAIEFYDNFEGENKEDEIGSSAGILMGIKASDFIELLENIKE